MGWLDSVRSTFSFLGSGSRSEDAVAEYLIREHHQGRSVIEILADPYVANRATKEQVDRILERPDVLRSLGSDTISSERP